MTWRERLPHKIKSILMPTDFSECSLEALDYAVLVAKAYEAEIVLLHVMEFRFSTIHKGVSKVFSQMANEGTQKLNALAKQVSRKGAKVQMLCRRGSPHNEIFKTAKDFSADLIVMGTHGRTGLEKVLIGSVAERVVQTAPCPVLTIRWTAPPDDTLEGALIPKHPFILPQFSG